MACRRPHRPENWVAYLNIVLNAVGAVAVISLIVFLYRFKQRQEASLRVELAEREAKEAARLVSGAVPIGVALRFCEDHLLLHCNCPCSSFCCQELGRVRLA